MNRNWRWFKTKISSIADFVTVIVISTGLMVMVIFAYTGRIEAGFLTAFATTVLAILTYLNVRSSTEAVHEMKKDREKPGIVRLIGTEIDTRIRKLENHSDKIGESQFRQPFSDSLYPIGRDERIEGEIEREFPGYSDLLDDYNQHINEYYPAVDELKSDIESYLKGKFIDQMSKKELGKIREIVDSHDLGSKFDELQGVEDPIEQAFFDEYAAGLAGMLIRLNLDDSSIPYGDAWDSMGDEFLTLRESEYQDRFDRLDRLLQSIREMNEELLEGLTTARSRFMDEYGIIESEVKLLKAEKDPELPDIF